ncbi:MAG: MBOAT family O-acyltransferase [Eubacteriales bacterium]|nr:MBOAT family O-acyltransferase [Eubacteriales bacterium]
MSFSSLFFIICFLPVYLLIYLLVPGLSRKNVVLLVFSLLFYAFGGLGYLVLLVAESAAAWFLALQMDKEDVSQIMRKRYLIISIAVFLGLLVIFKYTNFVLGSFASLFRISWDGLRIAMPLGVSFYTFKLISYTADVYNRKINAEKSFFIVLLYTAMFHNILQGPIVRFEETRKEILQRKMNLTTLTHGMFRFLTCLAMKTLLADACGSIADKLIPIGGMASVSTAAVWLGSIFYSLQMYLDFAAYSGMAVSLGEMVGFHYLENFNYPYIAVSAKDFWKRWHISLSLFFRDYIYIPLGGNRVSPRRTMLNVLIVWLATGIWHGAAWNFILWGLMYFVLITIENEVIRRRKDYLAAKGIDPADAAAQRSQTMQILTKIGHVMQHVYIIFFFNLGWLLFRFTNFGDLGAALKGFFFHSAAGGYNSAVGLTLKNNIFLLIVCILACTPIARRIGEFIEDQFETRRISKNYFYGLKTALAVVFLLLSLFAMAGNTYTPFLYNQF